MNDISNKNNMPQNANNVPMSHNIVLCGIKHCGKTTVGKALAAALNVPFVDTDDLIVEKDGGTRTVREIFKTEGEEYFRKMEAGILEELAASSQKQVIALGGGAFSNVFVTDRVKQELGFTVWLDVNDRIAYERIKAEGLPPFLQNCEDPERAFAEMNVARKEVFGKWCDFRCIPGATPQDTALRILQQCSR